MRKISKKEDSIIRRMNALAVAMDEYCHMTHPSAWDDLTKDMVKKWKELNMELNRI